MLQAIIKQSSTTTSSSAVRQCIPRRRISKHISVYDERQLNYWGRVQMTTMNTSQKNQCTKAQFLKTHFRELSQFFGVGRKPIGESPKNFGPFGPAQKYQKKGMFFQILDIFQHFQHFQTPKKIFLDTPTSTLSASKIFQQCVPILEQNPIVC